MLLRSLGCRTDLIFPAFDGQIIDRGPYLVVRTPENPTFYWGNYLLFGEPPADGDSVLWRTLFAQEFGSDPDILHQAFGWDSPEGDEGVVQPFLQSGFRLDRGVVLSADSISRDPMPSLPVSIRTLVSESDWEQEIENQVACRDAEHHEDGYKLFWQRQVDRYRRMIQADLGEWYGAFFEGRLAADLGVFVDQGVGRFQAVCTHPDFRRKGVASALLVEASRQVSKCRSVQNLVIVADVGSDGLRLYESLGFVEVERQVGLGLW